MIKLTNINKYYNKNRINQNHVCNNINLEINKTGLVVLLGKSGSGKTTLLNILSGMDKFDSGTLEFDGEIFQKYNSKKWDTLRKNKIGYIYQNYHLLKELSVYENIELVLKMYGMTDEDEIRNRVELLLESVGLKEYGDRLIKQLSGGQQQRIAFARALSKDPKVILADEPTGNLDSKTTIELMEILKRISETKLVIMVTHEQKLADFYADRIIEIDKGKVIIDKENTQKKDLNLLQEQIIYLKDYQKREIDDKTLKVTRYDRESDPELDLSVDLINRNDTLYVNVDADKPIKLKFINRDTEIEVLDETIKNIKQKEPIKIGPINQRVSNEKRSAITFKDAFHYALRKMNVLTFSDKLLYSILLLVGMIMSVSIGMIGETNRVDQTVSEQNRNYVTITTDKIPYEDIIAFEDIESIDQIMFINQKVSFNITSEKYYEVNSSIRLRALPVDIRFLDDSKIIYGEMPEGYGVVIDKSIADNLIRDYDVRGIGNYDDILKCSFKLQASGSDSDLPHDNALYFPITGIAKDYSESIWMSDELMYSIVTPTLIDHQILEDHFVITEGTLPPSFREVMLHEESPFLDQGAAPYSIGITTGEYFISGVYKYTKQDTDFNLQNLIVTTEDYLRHEYFASQYLYKNNFQFLVYSNDVEDTLHQVREMGWKAENKFLYEEEENQIIKFDNNANIYILSIAGIVATSIAIYFIMRTSLISRVYEVSVYRSLGASRNNIRKMFLVELLFTTTLSSIIGFLIMTFLIIQAESSIAGGIHLVHYTAILLLIGIGGLYSINVIFGLLPINILLRKTPAEIMRHFDL